MTTFSILLAAGFVMRAAALPFGLRYSALMPAAVLVYAGSNVLPLFYLKLNADRVFVPFKAESTTDEKIDRIAARYGITKRERQIIEEICKGRTNKQVADAMFISLQTVKDHTHRIYSKVGVRSRMQLVQVVNEGAAAGKPRQ